MKAEKIMLSPGKMKLKKLYILTLIVLAFTGFGQMPIFKRYYIADIPGLGWSADFYMTHYIHYIGSILFLGLIAYFIVDYFLSERRRFKLSVSSGVRILLLAGIVITGIFRVFKNFPDVVFSPGFTVFIDIAHLGFAMAFLFSALGFLIAGSGWVRKR